MKFLICIAVFLVSQLGFSLTREEARELNSRFNQQDAQARQDALFETLVDSVRVARFPESIDADEVADDMKSFSRVGRQGRMKQRLAYYKPDPQPPVTEITYIVSGDNYFCRVIYLIKNESAKTTKCGRH